MPVKPGGSGRGNLRDGAFRHGNLKRKAIPREYSPGHIMQMHERATVRLLKSANHLPGRVLGAHAHPCALV